MCLFRYHARVSVNEKHKEWILIEGIYLRQFHDSGHKNECCVRSRGGNVGQTEYVENLQECPHSCRTDVAETSPEVAKGQVSRRTATRRTPAHLLGWAKAFSALRNLSWRLHSAEI